VTEGLPLSADGVRELVDGQGGSVELLMRDDALLFSVELPLAGRTLLVVDDNADLVHLYRRYILGTPYQIVHLGQGTALFEAIDEHVPDLVVLDVMLPDVDGWELLANLHQHPSTRRLPVVVCTVVDGRELALALGADVYLPKPVQRDDFLRAVDQALS
jgi:CheY-like chemotaxis protein